LTSLANCVIYQLVWERVGGWKSTCFRKVRVYWGESYSEYTKVHYMVHDHPSIHWTQLEEDDPDNGHLLKRTRFLNENNTHTTASKRDFKQEDTPTTMRHHLLHLVTSQFLITPCPLDNPLHSLR
jgi:hypothetical protein